MRRIRNRSVLLAAAALALPAFLVCAGQALAAPVWLPATDLSAPLRDASGSRVAMDDAGHTVAVWQRQESNGPGLGVQASTRELGAGFSAPVDLSTHAQNPVVAITPGGEAIVAWWHFENPPGVYVLEASTRRPGGSFSPPEPVAALPKSVQTSEIQLEVSPTGDAVLAWTSREPEAEFSKATFVEASIRSAGGGFSEPEILSLEPEFDSEDASAPSAAIDAAGDAVVAWQFAEVEEVEVEPGVFEELTEVQIEAAVRPAGGEFSEPERLSEEGANAFSPAVAMDSAGNAIAVWTRGEGEEFTVQASVRPAGGPFPPAEDLSKAGADSFSPDIAMTPSGAATAVWVQSEEGEEGLEATMLPPGGEFTSPDEISSEGEEPLFPSLAVGSAGNAVVVWSGRSEGSQVARAVTRSGGGAFSAPAAISPTEPECCFHPDAAVDGVGNAVAIWTHSDGANRIAQAAGYDAVAPELRGLLIPATGTVGVPVSLSVEPFDVWSIASTSFDFGDDAAAGGTSVTHTYSSPGTFPVTATTVDAAGTATVAGGTIAIAASNDFHLGKVKRRKRKGTAVIVVEVPGPGTLTLSGKGVKKGRATAGGAGSVALAVKPSRGTLRKLKRRHKARVTVAVTFSPTGGTPATQPETIVLIKNSGAHPQRSR